MGWEVEKLLTKNEYLPDQSRVKEIMTRNKGGDEGAEGIATSIPGQLCDLSH